MEGRAVPACLSALHHPSDSKMMHKPTEKKCSGESAGRIPSDVLIG